MNQRARDVAQDLRDLDRLNRQLQELGDLELMSQFQDPSAGELVTRWDMIASPPDILVTNYSMLNVMLMRDIEEAVFDSTRRWLASSPRNVFTLVVDELHLYRGSTGAEVGMVVRNLASRLGLSESSDQLRIIATSASLPGDDSGLEYLERFFGVDRRRFAIEPGMPTPVADVPALNAAPVLGVPADERATSALGQRWAESIAAACVALPGERPKATSIELVATRLFGDDPQREEALGAMLAGLAASSVVT
jgi:DEAD/DEAH box helicase domain-containing protein